MPTRQLGGCRNVLRAAYMRPLQSTPKVQCFRSLAVHSLVQGLADGTGTGDLGLEVRLDLVGQHGLGQVAAEDGSVGQDAVQLIGDGLGLAELDAGKLGLQVVLQRIGGDLKGVAVVVDGQQVAQPTGDGQRNGNQACSGRGPRRCSS